jgi:hypothetical protein
MNQNKQFLDLSIFALFFLFKSLLDGIIIFMASGNTINYSIPFPVSTDPVNVSGDMEDLATRVDQVLKDEIGTVAFANYLYVSKAGDDENDGLTPGNAFLTIKKALSVASPLTCVFVKSGDYTEQNPLTVPARSAIWGDNLRTVTVRPANTNQDLFYVNNGCYLTGMTFRDHVSPGAAIAFNPDGSAGNIFTSPYIQDCSSITTTGTGMYIDGSKVGGLRSMVLDAYTQFNQGGIGIHVDNEGYAQLVSIFTICTQEGILCTNGATCSVTNSNSSFGTFGLKAFGVSPVRFSGQTKGITAGGKEIIVDGLDENLPAINGVFTLSEGISIDRRRITNDIATIRTIENHGIAAGTAIKISNVDSTFNGTHDVISATTNTLTFNLPGANTLEIPSSGKLSIFYTIDKREEISPGEFKLTVLERIRTTIANNVNVDFYSRSFIASSGHTFEYVGSGNNLFTAIPEAGGIPIQANEIVSSQGGQVFFTSTDQKGDFRIGETLLINRADGTITGRTFDRSLFAVMTPYILAIEG